MSDNDSTLQEMKELVQDFPIYKRMYQDKFQHYECTGNCKEFQLNGLVDKTGRQIVLVVRCTYCHAEDLEMCKGITQQGKRCRRKVSTGVGRINSCGFCDTHASSKCLTHEREHRDD